MADRRLWRRAARAQRAGVPEFLVRLVGVQQAMHLCRDTFFLPRHD